MALLHEGIAGHQLTDDLTEAEVVFGFTDDILHHRIGTGEGLAFRRIERMKMGSGLTGIEQIAAHSLVADLQFDHVANLLDRAGPGGILSGKWKSQ